MPKELHELLDKKAKELGYRKGTDTYNRYVYGTLAKHDKKNKNNKK